MQTAKEKGDGEEGSSALGKAGHRVEGFASTW